MGHAFHRRFAAAFVVVMGALLAPGAAWASSVVIGDTSLVPASGSAANLAPVDVPVFQGDASANYVLSSPVSGTITSWSFLSGTAPDGNQFVLRVLRPADATGTSWTAVETSGAVAVAGSGGVDSVQGPFATNLPVRAGDRIALEPQTDGNTPIEDGVVGQDGVRYFPGAFADGSTASIDPVSTADNGQVVPVQATVQFTSAPPAPVNQQLPVVSGLGSPGRVLSCSQGSWSNTPTAFAYQWLRDGAAVAGQTSQTYVVANGDVGHALACQVTATNAGGSGTATSASVTVTGGGGSGNPIARLTVPKARVPLGKPVTFDASGTVPNGAGIVSYTFNFGPKGGTATCGGQSPIVHAVFAQALSGTATVTVASSTGVTALATAPFAVTPRGPGPRAGASAIRHVGLVSYLCLPPAGSKPHRGIPEPGVAPTVICDITLHAGLLDARGCLNQVDFGSLPFADQARIAFFASVFAAGHKQARAGIAAAGRASGRGPISGPQVSALGKLLNTDDAFYVSDREVQINGLTYVPRPNHDIVIAVAGPVFSSTLNDPGAVYVISDDAIVEVENVPVKPGSIALAAGWLDGSKVHLADYQFDDNLYPVHLPQLPDLPVTGAVSIDLVKNASLLGLNVELPKVFNDAAEDDVDDLNKVFGHQVSHGITAAISLKIANNTGLQADHFEFNVPKLLQGTLGGVNIRNLHFTYDRPTRLLSGGLTVDVPAIGGGIGGSATFVHGDFEGASLFFVASAGEPGIPVVPPVYLTEIGGKLSLPPGSDPPTAQFPSEFTGDATFNIGPSLSSTGCGVASVRGTATVHWAPAPFSITATGENEIDCLDLGERYFEVDATGHVLLGEDWKLPLPFIGGQLSANIDGQALIDPADGRFHFQLDGSGSFGVDIGYLFGTKHVDVGGATAVLSDQGAALCGSAFGYTLGIGESFNPPPLNQIIAIKNLSLNMGGCDIAKYQPLGSGGPPSARDRRAHAASIGFDVPAGERTAIIQLTGQGGAPKVILHGPGGRVIDTAGGFSADANQLIAPQDATSTTIVEIRGRNAGHWTIDPDPGSPAIASGNLTHEVAPPQIHVLVSGHGAHRVLHYSLTPQPGERIEFLERGVRGAAAIGVAKGSRGSIRFMPSDARTGLRTVLAEITENGFTRPSIVVAHYFGSPVRPGRVGGLTARLVHGSLRISFRRDALATAYDVAVFLGDGRAEVLRLPGRAHTVRIPHVRRGERLVITVVGLRNGIAGPKASIARRHV